MTRDEFIFKKVWPARCWHAPVEIYPNPPVFATRVAEFFGWEGK